MCFGTNSNSGVGGSFDLSGLLHQLGIFGRPSQQQGAYPFGGGGAQGGLADAVGGIGAQPRPMPPAYGPPGGDTSAGFGAGAQPGPDINPLWSMMKSLGAPDQPQNPASGGAVASASSPAPLGAPNASGPPPLLSGPPLSDSVGAFANPDASGSASGSASVYGRPSGSMSSGAQPPVDAGVASTGRGAFGRPSY